jgi:CheY-like chemotaxis protein
MMPGMDGIEAVRIIREEIGTDYARNVPVIALTANAIFGSDKMFLENGFQAFLSKPIEIHRMDQVLRQWVRNRDEEEKLPPETLDSAGEAVRRTAGSLAAAGREALGRIHRIQPPRPVIAGLNLEDALNRFGGDEEVLRTVLNSFANNTPQLVAQLRNPSPENLRDYTIAVHGLKSSCYGVGASEAGDMAKALEDRSGDGDLDFVLSHNQRFLVLIEKLIQDIAAAFGPKSSGSGRPVREAPDPALLAKLRDGCLLYNMDLADEALNELEAFEYEKNGQLITWLREQAEQTAFEEMVRVLNSESQAASVPAASPAPPGEPARSRPVLPEPDARLLARLAQAAGEFNMDQVDDLTEELLSFNYQKKGALAEWIREKAQALEFAEIRERLTQELAGRSAGQSGRPRRPSPDPAVLDHLLRACRAYDMDAVDEAMQDLETFHYHEGGDLVAWLREKISLLDFEEVMKRLSG